MFFPRGGRSLHSNVYTHLSWNHFSWYNFKRWEHNFQYVPPATQEIQHRISNFQLFLMVVLFSQKYLLMHRISNFQYLTLSNHSPLTIYLEGITPPPLFSRYLLKHFVYITTLSPVVLDSPTSFVVTSPMFKWEMNP